MSLYRNQRWKFEIDLPEGWKEPGSFRKLLRSYDSANPELYGPKEAALKFAIGSICPEPHLEQMQRNIESIAHKYDHFVVETGSISVLRKEHATILYHIPLPGDRSLRLKNYHLVLNGIEFLVTGKVALFTGIQGMAGPVPGIYSQAALAAALIPRYPELLKLYAYTDDYDNIIETFKMI